MKTTNAQQPNTLTRITLTEEVKKEMLKTTIELRNIKINLSFSEETTMFKADLYVNGIKTAYAENEGRGGSTYYKAYNGMIGLLNKAEEYAESLPSKTVTTFNEPFSYDMNLEHLIDDLVFEELENREWKKIEKRMEKSIIWGMENLKGNYTEVGFKVLLSEIPTAKLQEFVDKYKKELKDGEVFWNTNFEKLGIKI